MTQPRENLPKVRPFIERKTQPRRNGVDIRGLLSTSLMFVSLGAITVAMGGAAIVVFGIFSEGLANSLSGIGSKVIVLALAYAFGWGMAVASIRGFGNLIYPLIIQIYAWICLIAIGLLYLKVIQKLFIQEYDGVRFWAYVLMLLGGLLALIGLHLLIEGHDLRPFAVPLLILTVLQLFAIVFRYVFTSDAQPIYLFGDLTIFFLMISISALMLMHLGLLSGVRARIDGWFSHNGNTNGNGNGRPQNSDAHWVD